MQSINFNSIAIAEQLTYLHYAKTSKSYTLNQMKRNREYKKNSKKLIKKMNSSVIQIY